MIFATYRLSSRLAAPVLRRMLARRKAAGKEISHRLTERFGTPGLPRPEGRLIWFHAASVGETISVLPVISALAGQVEVLLTTGTATSARIAAARLPADARHQFIPLDVPAWVTAFLKFWHPEAAVFVESELWPNLLDTCDSLGIPRLLINARISERSTRNWRRGGALARRVLAPFRYIHAQSTGDARRLEALGLRDLLDWGNLKFFAQKLPCDEAALAALRAQIPGPVWLAASTHPGEESLVRAAHAQLVRELAGLVTIIVPRHPERGAEIASGSPRRALGQAPRAGEVYIADTLGELGLFFRLAPFAFIGNSLAGFGGHNIIEPAVLGRPVITGPHTENFAEAAERLRVAGALAEVADAAGLAQAALHWLRDPAACHAAGQRAAAVFLSEADLPERLAGLILDCAL